jgi:leader peptidase (prepilin peptidase)/N-methyltransferase
MSGDWSEWLLSHATGNGAMLVFWLVSAFVLGTIVGSLLNVCIYRIPLEKSLLWPGSRCSQCLQSIRWYDNIPLFSYLWLRGRCRTCGSSFSIRYFLIELFTGLCFVGLFYLEVIDNVHGFTALKFERNNIIFRAPPSWVAWVVFVYHAVFISYLIAASFIDLEHREIPFAITVPGTVIGLLGAVVFAWPWPNRPAVNLGLVQGLYPWPFWWPLPAWWCTPGVYWWTGPLGGLTTGLVGALVGTLMLRVIRFLFGLGLGIEALGLGDADLMMMAGAFLGWQPVLVGFFIGVFVGLFFGIIQWAFRGDNMLPFGPGLAIGVVIAMLGWSRIGPYFQLVFFNGYLVTIVAAFGCMLLLVASYFLRILRLLRGQAGDQMEETGNNTDKSDKG